MWGFAETATERTGKVALSLFYRYKLFAVSACCPHSAALSLFRFNNCGFVFWLF
jgi:hypothetical protein